MGLVVLALNSCILALLLGYHMAYHDLLHPAASMLVKFALVAYFAFGVVFYRLAFLRKGLPFLEGAILFITPGCRQVLALPISQSFLSQNLLCGLISPRWYALR